MIQKTKVFIPVEIFDKETVGVVYIPTKNDCYVKEQEGYFFTADELKEFAIKVFEGATTIDFTGRNKKLSDSICYPEVRYFFIPFLDWLKKNHPIKTLPKNELKEDELTEKIKDVVRNKNLYDATGRYDFDQLIVEFVIIAKKYSNSKLEELEKWIEEQKITPEFNNKIIGKIKSLK